MGSAGRQNPGQAWRGRPVEESVGEGEFIGCETLAFPLHGSGLSLK